MVRCLLFIGFVDILIVAWLFVILMSGGAVSCGSSHLAILCFVARF